MWENRRNFQVSSDRLLGELYQWPLSLRPTQP